MFFKSIKIRVLMIAVFSFANCSSDYMRFSEMSALGMQKMIDAKNEKGAYESCCEGCKMMLHSTCGVPGGNVRMNIFKSNSNISFSARVQDETSQSNFQCQEVKREFGGCQCGYSTSEKIVLKHERSKLNKGYWIDEETFAVHIEAKASKGAIRTGRMVQKKSTCLSELISGAMYSMVTSVKSDFQNGSFELEKYPSIFVNSCENENEYESCSCNIVLKSESLKSKLATALEIPPKVAK